MELLYGITIARSHADGARFQSVQELGLQTLHGGITVAGKQTEPGSNPRGLSRSLQKVCFMDVVL